MTETCEPNAPHLIVNVETTVAAETEFDALPNIHRHLQQREVLPTQHLVDGGYGSSDMLLHSQQRYNVDLFCPVPQDNSWQARTPHAFSIYDFTIDWDAQTVRCPAGKHNHTWRLAPTSKSPHKNVILVSFRKADCVDCPLRSRCTRSPSYRTLALLIQPEFDALQKARVRQHSPEFLNQYNLRAGIEGTLSQCVTQTGLRRSRYIGLAKTHLQHILSAAAVNIVRAVHWLAGTPHALTRLSHFAALAAS